MAKLNIVKDGDPVLRKVCRPVEAVTPRIRTLLDKGFRECCQMGNVLFTRYLQKS